MKRVTDRAQDTEAIRAARNLREWAASKDAAADRDRIPRGAEARMLREAAELIDRLVTELGLAASYIPASRVAAYRMRRAALAAAAPGETTPDAVVWSEPRQDYTGRVYRDGLATGTSAAPGETEQTP